MSDAGEPVALCALDDLEDPGARAIDLAHGSVIVVRTGTRVAGYVNACPHKGTPLENPLGEATCTRLGPARTVASRFPGVAEA